LEITMTDSARGHSPDPSVGQLVSQFSEQSSRLIREELELARLELTESVRHAGRGAGLFGAAGVVGLFGVGAMIATSIIALDLVLPLWAAALIVTVVLFAAAGVASLLGKREVDQVSPIPERAVENVKRDVHEVQEARSHDHIR
jgi:uncharacterized membrane protein YqjE